MRELCSSLLIILALSGCAARISPSQRLSMDRFIGRSSAYLVAELGPAQAVHRSGNRTDLTFVSRQDVIVPAEPGFYYPGVNVPSTAWLDSQQCNITFRVQNGAVAAWSVSGNHCSDMPLPQGEATRPLFADTATTNRDSSKDVLGAAQLHPVLNSLIAEKGDFYTR